jgi:hypothetical protein
MIPRTHNVTLLLLVPQSHSRKIKLNGSYQLRDFRDGSALESESKDLETTHFEVHPQRAARLDMVSAGGYALTDDGKEATVSIDGGTDLTSGDIAVSMTVEEAGKGDDGKALPKKTARFAASSVKVDGARRVITANLRSPLNLGYKEPAIKLHVEAFDNWVLKADGGGCLKTMTIQATHLKFKEDKDPLFALSSPLPMIWTDRDRLGTFSVYADFDKQKLSKLHYRLYGADVVSVACRPACPDANRVDQSSIIEFTVKNLSNRVTIKAGAEENKLGQTGVDLIVVNKEREEPVGSR